MGLIRNERFVCVDCESTGLDPDSDAIIEVGAVCFTLDETLDTFETLIDPECTIPPESIAIHHITDEMVAGKPKIAAVLPKLLPFLDNATVIGHGVLFDLQLIENAAKRAQIPCHLATRRYIDTLRLARLYGESPRNSLDVLRQHFNISCQQAHRALDDAVVNMEVFRHLVARYRSMEQIYDALAKPVRLKTMPLGKHKGRRFDEVPIAYLRWAAHQKFDQDLLFSIREELRRRKKGSGFRQSANPFDSL